jgi:hypothetical protein
MKTFKTKYAAAAFALAAFAPALSHAAGVEILNEGFDNVANLSGWARINHSASPGLLWFQGNGVLTAADGSPTSYIAANYLGAVNGTGSLDNWLITPMLNLSGTSTLSFTASRSGEPGFADLLEIRFAPGQGTGTDGFSLLDTISGTRLTTNWDPFQYSVNVDGPGRFAFRYVGDAATLNYVGLDTVRVVSAVPEPSLYLTLAMGLGALSLLRRKFVK